MCNPKGGITHRDPRGYCVGMCKCNKVSATGKCPSGHGRQHRYLGLADEHVQ